MQDGTTSLVISLAAVFAGAYLVTGTLTSRSPWAMPATLMAVRRWIRTRMALVQLASLVLLFGKGGVIVVSSLISFAALREYVTLTDSRRADRCALLGMFLIVIPVQYTLIWIDWYGFYAFFIPVVCFLALPALTAIRGDSSRFLERVSEQQWGLMLAVYCLSHVAALITLADPSDKWAGVKLVAFVVAAAQCGDDLRFIARKVLGRLPASSIARRFALWLELLVGLSGTALLGAVMARIVPFPPYQAAGIAAILAFLGFLGSIVSTTVNRGLEAKSGGQALGDRTEILDRIHGLAFAAPVFFHIVRFTSA